MDKILNFPVTEQIKTEINQLAEATGIKKQFLLAKLVELGIKEYKIKHRL